MRLWDRLLKPATFDAINLSCDLRLIFMAIQLRLFMTFTHAAVSIERMKWTLTLQAASLQGPKITEQMSQNRLWSRAFRTLFRNPRRKHPPPLPLSCSLSKYSLSRRYKFTHCKCNDFWNLFFLIRLMLFYSFFVLFCYLFTKWAWL